MDINLYEFNLKKDSEIYRIIEENRGNNYKLKNMNEEIIYSGEYIFENIDIFTTIDTPDLCKIIYTTGFNKGRKMSLVLKATVKDYGSKTETLNRDNIITFKNPN